MTRRTRAELVAEYRALLDQGLTRKQIAEKLGKPYVTVTTLLSDPDGSRQRANRKKHEGRCEHCGGPTNASRAIKPRFCIRCIRFNPDWAEKQNVRWNREIIIERVQEWAVLYGETPAARDWNPAQARAQGRDDLAERFAGGHWPHVNTVSFYFGSWNAAIRAAGYTARRSGVRKVKTA